MTRVERDGNTANFALTRRAGDLVFVSGQASVEDGAIVPGTFAEEMDRALANLRRALAAEGLALSDVVQVTAYVRDPADLAEYNSLYQRHFTAPLPARTTLTGCLSDRIRFEIDAVAAGARRPAP